MIELLVTSLLAYLLTLGTQVGCCGLKINTHGLHGGEGGTGYAQRLNTSSKDARICAAWMHAAEMHAGDCGSR